MKRALKVLKEFMGVRRADCGTRVAGVYSYVRVERICVVANSN